MREGDAVLPETASSTGDVVRGRFPTHYVVSEAAVPGRFEVHDRVSRTSWALGSVELAVARQFDGAQTYHTISMVLQRSGLRISPAGLRVFETRLIALGILEDGRRGIRRRARVLVRYLFVLDQFDVGSFDPSRVLDVVHRGACWLHRRPWVLLLSAVSAGIVALLGTRLGEFVHTVPISLQGWGLLGLYGVVAVSSIFHEGGHALSCRAYGVPVRAVGIGLRSLIVFAWTEPDGDAWSRLSLHQRLVTVIAGPLGSLWFAAIGAVVWLSPAPEPLRAVGVLVVLAGTVCVIPTLLPIFNGDAYLVLTDMLNQPNLRSKSFQYVRLLLSGAGQSQQLAPRTAMVYIVFALVTVFGRLATIAFVLWLFWVCSVQPVFG